MVLFAYIILFILGLSLGSFLNVMIDRWPKGKSVIKTRSHCDYCKKTLKIPDLIPVLSFVLLGGRCRYCHKKLSWQYPLLELSTALLLVLTYYLYRHFPILWGNVSFLLQNFTLNGLLVSGLLFTLLAVPVFVAIFMIDLKYGLILDQVILPAIGGTILFYLFQIAYYSYTGYNGILGNPLGKYILIPNNNYFYSLLWRFSQPLVVSFLVGILVALFFVLLIIISRGRGLGLGDIRLGFWLGLLLGYPKILVGLFLSFILGGAVAFILVVLRKKKFGETVPLAPFLMIGSYIALFFGNQIISWYTQRFL